MKKFLIIVLVVTGLAGLIYWAQGNGPVQAAPDSSGGEQAPQAMPVEVTEVKPEKIQIWKNFSGQVVAVDRAEIRPQVSGRITEIRFEDGEYVEKGDVLIVIDPRPYEAAVNQAEANLKAAKTQADLAEKEFQRAKNLIKTEAISKSVLDERINNRDSAAASVKAAEAALENAQINLDYAFVEAPISGKVSRAEITVGNLVQSGPSAPLLTSIVADEKVYVDFEVDERTYLNSIRGSGSQKASDTPVRVKLGGGDIEYDGFLQSFDNRIDPASGTIRARAIFENADRLLLPGMSVTVLIGGAEMDQQIVITERAIGTDQDRKFVYIINEKGMAEYREIKIGDSLNGKRVVLSGLSSGDSVISEGIVRIRPGMPVIAKADQQTSVNKMKGVNLEAAESH